MIFGRKTEHKDCLIFLDIDGVLNDLSSEWAINSENIKSLYYLVKKLEKKNYDCKIILVSTWRFGFDKDFKKCSPQVQSLIKELNTFGLKVYDKTKSFEKGGRAYEVCSYYLYYEFYIAKRSVKHLIIDDDISLYSDEVAQKLDFNMNLIVPNSRRGLVDSDWEKVIKKF